MDKTKKKGNIFARIAKYLFPWRGDSTSEIIRKIVFLAAFAALVVTLTILAKDYFTRNDQNTKDKELADMFHSGRPVFPDAGTTIYINTDGTGDDEYNAYPDMEPREVMEEFYPLLEINPETIGWLTIQGTNEDYRWIDYPVMQTTNNDKYLNYNIYGEERQSGALFVDCEEKITPTKQPANIIIYGHNMATGEYFGRLPWYFNYAMSTNNPEDISFYKNHPTVEFSTLYGRSTYKIFAAMMLNTEEEAGEVFEYYKKVNFKGQADFNEYVAEILDRSTFYNPDVNVQYGDNLLTLSTCMLGYGYGDTDLRFVVFARETREGESPEVNVNRAYYNPNPKFYDLYYEVRDYEWKGRNWDKNLLVGYEG